MTGASHGVGVGLAKGVIEAGADVAISARGEEQLKETAEKLSSKYESKVLPLPTDVSDPEMVNSMVDKAKEEFGEINFLFNNAGICPRHPSEEFPVEDWEQTMAVNAKGVFLCSKKVANVMIDQGQGGNIINTASMLSFTGGKRLPAYCASKGAVLQLTKALANDWAKYDINVNAIAPGWIKTPLTKPLTENKKRNTEITSKILMGRWGEPEDLAGTAVFLASPASDYITGQTIPVDGGWLYGTVDLEGYVDFEEVDYWD